MWIPRGREHGAILEAVRTASLQVANRTPGAVRVDHGLLLKGSELRVVQKKMKYMWPARPVFSIRLSVERV